MLECRSPPQPKEKNENQRHEEKTEHQIIQKKNT